MGTNSIRENLTKEDTISIIKLYLSEDIDHKNTYMIVEGETDIKFWKYMAKKDVVLLESFSGKKGVKEIIEENFIYEPRVIGIVDKDYENVEEFKNIFFYDCCCLEMMLIKNENVFEKIYGEYYFGQLKKNELRKFLLSELKFISLIRKTNEEEKLNLRVKGISINNAFDKNEKKIQVDIIIDKLKEMNEGFFSNNTLELDINSEMSVDELLDITQGHDFSTLFATYCNSLRKKRNSHIKSADIEQSLRCIYTKEDFRLTNLYAKLYKYQNENNIKII